MGVLAGLLSGLKYIFRALGLLRNYSYFHCWVLILSSARRKSVFILGPPWVPLLEFDNFSRVLGWYFNIDCDGVWSCGIFGAIFMKDSDKERRVTYLMVILCILALLMYCAMISVENRDLRLELDEYKLRAIGGLG